MASGMFNIRTNNDSIVATFTWSVTENWSSTGANAEFTYTLTASKNNKTEYVLKSGTATVQCDADKHITEIVTKRTISQDSLLHTQLSKHTFFIANKSKVSIVINATYNNGEFQLVPTSKTIDLNIYKTPTKPTVMVPSVKMGLALSITTNDYGKNYKHDLKYTFGSATGTIATNVSSGATWIVPTELANQIPKSKSGTLTIECITKGMLGEYIGASYVSLPAEVPSYSPVVNTISITDPKGYATTYNGYIKDVSGLKITATGSSSYSATISAYSVTVFGNTYATKYEASTISQTAGTYTATIKVTDSRGVTATKSQSFTIQDYIKPKISLLSAVRCDSDGTSNEYGAYTKVTFNASITPLNTNNNSKSFKLEYKKQTGSWTTIGTYNSSYNWNSSIIALADTEESYEIRLTAADKFNTSVLSTALSTAYTMMDFNSNGFGMAIGRVSSAGSKDLELGIPLMAYNGIKDNNNYNYARFRIVEMGTFTSSQTEDFTNASCIGWQCIGIRGDGIVKHQNGNIAKWYWNPNIGQLHIVKDAASSLSGQKCTVILIG